jgi:magnesium chelatase accessory protein
MAELLPRPPATLVGINAALGPFEGFAGWLFPKLARLMAVSLFGRICCQAWRQPAQGGKRAVLDRVETVGGGDLYRRLLAMPGSIWMARWHDGATGSWTRLMARLPQTAVPVLLLIAGRSGGAALGIAQGGGAEATGGIYRTARFWSSGA